MADNPLAQFNIVPLYPIELGGVDVSFTNASFMMVLIVALAGMMMLLGKRKAALVPGRWQAANEMLIEFIQDMTKSNAGSEGMKFFPLIFTVFIFVLFANLLGMVPTAFTITSHIVVTFAMASLLFLAITLLGILKHGTKFLSLFLPSGTPIFLVPLMIPIELISYFARPFSLAIRLAANMMAGHILLKIMAGFIGAGVLTLAPAALIAGLASFSFIVIFTGFELFVACLQAYIFTLLACVYLHDALYLH